MDKAVNNTLKDEKEFSLKVEAPSGSNVLSESELSCELNPAFDKMSKVKTTNLNIKLVTVKDKVAALGFEKYILSLNQTNISQANLADPLFPGSTDEEQIKLLSFIDSQSEILYDIVQEIEKAQLKASEKVLLELKQPVVIPSTHLAEPDHGPEIKLRMIDPYPSFKEEQCEIIKRAVTVGLNRASNDLHEGNILGYSPGKFSSEQTVVLMKALEEGWKREIVLRADSVNFIPGKKKNIGDLYYTSPDGIKFRSSKEVKVYLEANPELGLSMDNFSFYKSRVSFDSKQETVRIASSGRKSSGLLLRQILNQTAQETPKSSSSRRVTQAPKRYANDDVKLLGVKKLNFSANPDNLETPNKVVKDARMEIGMLPNNYYPRKKEASFRRKVSPDVKNTNHGHSGQNIDLPMFGIEALMQSFPFEQFGDEMKDGRLNVKKENEQKMNHVSDGLRWRNESGEVLHLLPCSIQCPKAFGKLPTLQCTACFCFFHYLCMGLPHERYKNFVCSNCDYHFESSGHEQSKYVKHHQTKNPQQLKTGMQKMAQLRKKIPPIKTRQRKPKTISPPETEMQHRIQSLKLKINKPQQHRLNSIIKNHRNISGSRLDSSGCKNVKSSMQKKLKLILPAIKPFEMNSDPLSKNKINP